MLIFFRTRSLSSSHEVTRDDKRRLRTERFECEIDRAVTADIFVARASRAALNDRPSELDRRIRNACTLLAHWVGNASYEPPIRIRFCSFLI